MFYDKGLFNGFGYPKDVLRLNGVEASTDVFGLSPMSPMPPLSKARECCGLGFCQKLLY